MIHIQRTEKPSELTDDLCARLTAEYIKDHNKAVWNKPFIRSSLLRMTHSKCCYCEKQIGSGKPDMHIDHFKPKSRYPEEVVEWNNLNPSCPDCNRNKSEHDTFLEPIVNPFVDNPQDYFYLKDFRYKPRETDANSKARQTIDVLWLNDIDKKCLPRFQIVSELTQKLEQAYSDAVNNRAEIRANISKRNRITNTCRDILKKCCPDAEYSAFTSTAIHTDPEYRELKTLLQEEHCWTEELEILDQASRACIYNYPAAL